MEDKGDIYLEPEEYVFPPFSLGKNYIMLIEPQLFHPESEGG